jgi:hypothetical protein
MEGLFQPLHLGQKIGLFPQPQNGILFAAQQVQRKRAALPRVHPFPANLSYGVGERFKACGCGEYHRIVRFGAFFYLPPHRTVPVEIGVACAALDSGRLASAALRNPLRCPPRTFLFKPTDRFTGLPHNASAT